MNNVKLKRIKTQLDCKLCRRNFKTSRSIGFLVISRFIFLTMVLIVSKKAKENHLEIFFVENFRDLKVIASRRPKIAACNYICY